MAYHVSAKTYILQDLVIFKMLIALFLSIQRSLTLITCKSATCSLSLSLENFFLKKKDK